MRVEYFAQDAAVLIELDLTEAREVLRYLYPRMPAGAPGELEKRLDALDALKEKP